MLVSSYNNPIILNEISSKQVKENKNKIERLNRASDKLDSEERLERFLKDNTKDMQDIIKLAKNKKYIDNYNGIGVLQFSSALGMYIGALVANHYKSGTKANIGGITFIISCLTLIGSLIAEVAKYNNNKEEFTDIENMQKFCRTIKNNLSKHIQDPNDIQNPKLKTKYLEIMHQLDLADNQLYKAAHNYDRRKETKNQYITSAEEIKLRAEAIKNMTFQIKPFTDVLKININGDENVRNFVSGYEDKLEIIFGLKKSTHLDEIETTYDKIENILNDLSNDKIKFRLEHDEYAIEGLDELKKYLKMQEEGKDYTIDSELLEAAMYAYIIITC